tara:strand:+ start:1431 stop:4049 length:2619 start_codon:yes stop_codon:yes gene_type:complete
MIETIPEINKNSLLSIKRSNKARITLSDISKTPMVFNKDFIKKRYNFWVNNNLKKNKLIILVKCNYNLILQKNYLRMEKYFLLLLALPIFINAQNEITGSITDNEGNPIPFTDIFLVSESKVMTNDRAITDFEGKFKIITKRKGNYYAEIRSLGFRTYISENFIIGTNNSNIKLGQIKLKEESFALNDVEVSSKRKVPYQRKIDRTVIDIEEDAGVAGSSILDVLERTPGVIVDRQAEGISMLGKSGVNVMINGKLSYMPTSALVQFLNGVNANNVKSIELITTPPSKFDAEGNAGFINIELKKGSADKGYNGNFTSSSGYGDGNFNNDVGGNINVTDNKSNLIFNYSFKNNRLPREAQIFRTLSVNNVLVDSETNMRRDNNDRLVQNLRFSYDYNITEKINIGTTITGYSNRYRMEENKTMVHSNFLNTSDIYFTTEDNYWKSAQVGVFTKYKISETSSIEFIYDYLTYSNDQPMDYQIDINASLNPNDVNLETVKKSPFDISVYNLDFEKKFSEKFKYSGGVKYILNDFRNSNSLIRNGEFDSVFGNESYLDEFILAGYSQLNFDLSKKIKVQSGIRYEHTTTDIMDLNTNDMIVERSYGDFFPSIFIGYKINDFSNFNLSLSKRINRPAFTDIAPFVFFINIDQVMQGNVQLKPSYTENYEINYRFKNINLTMQYSEETDVIGKFQPSVDSETGFITLAPANLDSQKTISSVLSYSFFPVSIWNVRFFTTYSYSELKDSRTNYNTTNSNIRLNLNNNFELGNNFTFQLWGFYNSKQIFGIANLLPMGSLNLALQKKLKNFTLTLNAENILDSQRFRFEVDSQNLQQNGEFNFRPPQTKLSLIYNFGNQELKTKKIKSSSEADRVKISGS